MHVSYPPRLLQKRATGEQKSYLLVTGGGGAWALPEEGGCGEFTPRREMGSVSDASMSGDCLREAFPVPFPGQFRTIL